MVPTQKSLYAGSAGWPSAAACHRDQSSLIWPQTVRYAGSHRDYTLYITDTGDPDDAKQQGLISSSACPIFHACPIRLPDLAKYKTNTTGT